MAKSTVQQIRERFDNDVERFSNLETGQSATIDAPLVLDLIVNAAAAASPGAEHILDIGCGAGNYTLKLVSAIPGLNCTLLDLSAPMLERAQTRCKAAGAASVTTVQGDIREIGVGVEKYDIVVAAAVLHHLRTDEEWEQVFTKIHRGLKPGGSLWISDLIVHSCSAIQELMWERYGDYLVDLNGQSYRDLVFQYIEREDTPKPLLYQLALLRTVGFREVEVLHKNSCFAAFGAIR